MPLTLVAGAEIDALLDAQNDADDPKMASKKDRILEILKDCDESYVMELNPKFVGICPENRDEDGMSDDGVHCRGSKITYAGWSWKAVEHETVAMEDNPNTKHIAKKTVEITRLSDRLAIMKIEEIKVGSLGAGHTNQWLCCIIDGVPCAYANMSENGRMSKSKLFKDKGIEGACTTGLRWTIIRWQMAIRFPKLAAFLQSALNIRNHIGKGHIWHTLSAYTQKHQ